MGGLVSKIQFSNFEIGEFVEERVRTYAEIIDLIEHYPWDKQRQKIAIALTNPSITIEGANCDFLKLAIFYNQKFVLHYINSDQVLLTKSFTDLKCTYKYINDYFCDSLDVTDFKKENTWLQHNLKHFVTQDFKYLLSTKSISRFLLSTSGINFGYTVFVVLLFSFKGTNHLNGVGLFAIILTICFIGGGVNMFLFINHYIHSKNKILVMSKGNDIFYYGRRDNPIKYCKLNIVKFTTTRSASYKSPISGFGLVSILLKDGTLINIPNLLADYSAIEEKLSGYPKIEEKGFPYI